MPLPPLNTSTLPPIGSVPKQESIDWFSQTWFGRGMAAASTTGEATDLMSQNFSNIDMESIQEFMKAKESEANSYVPSDRMSKFQEQYVKEGKTWTAFFRGVKDQPGLLPELFVQSLGTQVGTLFDSPGSALGAAAAGAGVGAVGGVAGALAGAMGGLATSMEAALTFGELIETRLKEKGQDFTDENIKALLEAEGTEIRNKSIGRGLTIGAIEGLSGGLAGKAGVAASKVAKGAKRAKLAAGGAGVGVEAIGGATGEVLGRVAAGQEMDAAEIGFEAITGTVTAPLNVSAALLTAKKPTYRLNGQSITYEQMKNFVDTADDMDVAKADIQMQNDFTGVGKKAKAKQEAAIEGIKLSGDVETIAEVSKAQSENRIAATIELAKQGKQIANVKDSFAVENNEEAIKAYKEIQDQYGKDVIPDQDVANADGFFVPTPDGNVIIINKDIAAKTGQINVGGHELLHAVVQKHYKSLMPEARAKFINDFKSTISKESLAYVQKIIDARNKAGEDIKTDSDEYLTIYSDGIVKKDITYNESVFTKFKNFLQDIFRKFGYNKEFGSGLDTYNFMRDYNKNITEFNKISQRAFDVAGSEAVAGKASLSRGSLIEDINKLQKGATTKDDFQKPEVFNPVFESLKNGGAINNYIRSLQMSPEKTRETIDSVTDRLINFDPAAKRKDGTVIGPEGLGEFIMANVGFGKLDAAKSLAIKTKEQKRTTSIDSEEAKELTNENKTAKKQPKGQKARVLKSLADVNINNKEVISSTARAEINALIEQNPKNLEEKISNIIDKEITKAVKAQMGKISKEKGKVVISDEYKAFIAFNYTDIVQSLDVATIKKNYNTLFELTEIGKEDRKTKKSDKPSLKKDSNYRKNIYKIETNKAKFTKFFTEGGYTTLLARQKGLAKQIAEGIVEDIVNNEIINNSENNEAIVNAELRNVANSLNKQKKEVQGNYNDQIKFSRLVSDQTSQLSIKVQESTYVDEVFNTKTGVPIDEFDRDGDPWLPEAYKPIFGLVENGNIIPKGTKNNVFRKLMDKLKLPTDKTIGDTFERWYYAGAKEIGLLAKGFVLTEDNIMMQSIGSFTRKVVQAPDLILEFVNSIGRTVKVGFEIKATGNTKMGHNKPFVKDIKNPDYEYKKNADLKGNPKNPKFVNDKLEEVFNNVASQAEVLSKYLKKEFNVDWKSRQDFIPFLNEDNRIVYNDEVVKELKAAVNGLGKDGKSVTINGDFVAHHYNAKGVFYIQIAGKGLFYLGSDPLGLAKSLGVTKFEGNFDLKGRLLVSPKNEKGVRIGRYASIDVEPIMDPRRITSKVGFSLDQPGAWKALKKALKDVPVISDEVTDINTLNNAIKKSRSINDPKGITVLDFDDTLATTKSLVKFTTPEGETGTLNAEEYASTYEDLLDKGYVFDFSDFNKVVKGKLAPLFNKAIKLQGKFGSKNMFVLTARPPQAQKAIFDFLKANGLNIPLENITGLGNSTAEAKALWIADKVSEGFNDFYFADDALQNVQAVKNMLDQFDVKSKVQQARVKFSKTMSDDFNDILEEVTGIESEKRFARTKARKRGADKGKFRLFIPPSHEDFVGLLYNFMGKGRRGDAHRNFLEQALVRPLLRAHREIDTAKQAVANDYKALNKQMPGVNKMLSKKTPDGDFTYQDAIRVYIWDKHGYKIPGLSEVDQAKLVDIVNQNSDLQVYAETINTISKQETYVDPGPNWETGNIRIDLVDATGRVGRKTYFAEFQENADIIFSEENLNKIEAGYGAPLREALEDMLHRIKTGVNRPKGSSAKPNMFMNWLNASVAGVMFMNVRSSLLQQMSNVNYLNFADNNILAAGKAFANQPQYWDDFGMIFNSDMMKQRRGGLQTDINGAELAEAIKKARPGNLFDQVAIITGKALRLGFLPTQIGDNIAIATGGAAFYRNRVNKYIKEGLSIKEAETKAFNDFQEITQSTQQSAKPYMTSAQQSSWIGKIVLNFLNTPSQYNRIIKKAASDIINRRITPPNTTQLQSDMSNVSRILYYGAAQNLIFYSLQTALFAVMFGSDDEDEDKRVEAYLTKKQRVIQGSIDTILRGSGIYGVAVSTLKNMAIKFMEQREKGYNPDESAVIMEMLNFSPVVGIKARRIVNAEKTLNYNKKVIEEMETFDIDNPQWSAVTNYVQTITTAPTNKIYQKTINLRNAADRDYTALQRLLFLSGYTTWSLGLGDTKKMKEIKEKVKSKKTKKSGLQPISSSKKKLKPIGSSKTKLRPIGSN